MIDRTERTRWLLAAVLTAMPAMTLSSSAFAQTQKPTDGRTLDANNRIGSGGTNTYRPPPSAGVFGNNIVNGNVGGGKEFRGSVGYSDPSEFHGFQPGRATDNFIKDSSQVGVGTAPPPIPGASTTIFSPSRFAPPPQPGFTSAPNGLGYVPEKATVVQASDARLGAQLGTQPLSVVPKAGELLLPGPIDPTSNQMTVLSASPLTGIRQLNAGNAGDASYLQRYTGAQPESVMDRLRMDASDVQRMRSELLVGGAGTSANGTVGTRAPNLAQPIGAPLESPANAAITHQPTNASIQANAFNGSLRSDEGTYSKIVGTAAQQSTQYDELKKRLERYQTDRKSTAELGADQFNAANRVKKAAEDKVKSTQKPNEVPVPTDDATKPKIGLDTKPGPVAVKTMTSGIAGKGLKEILSKAELLMKEGKFTSAIDQYSAAEQVAPNQPLVWVGRANAELGASYYNRAEGHLKQAFASDQALLMAQYDLRSFLGEDRLQSVIKDLKEIASTDQQSPTPVFLLAYISYNTGNERRAAGYLDLAEKRSDGKDPSYKLLRDHWSLPTAGEPAPTTPAGEPKPGELNK